MTGKITAALVAAMVFASAGVASAQTNRRPVQASVLRQAPVSNSYYNNAYWAAVAPNGKVEQRDPYAGTIWEGVAPY